MRVYSKKNLIVYLIIGCGISFGVGVLINGDFFQINSNEKARIEVSSDQICQQTNMPEYHCSKNSSSTNFKLYDAQFSHDFERAVRLEDEANSVEIYRLFNKGVVNVTAVIMDHNWFLEAIPRAGTGSGSVIDDHGLVLTNYHVIKGAQEVSVTFSDGEERKGEVVGIDPENDLAVVKFDPENLDLTIIPFGTSSNLVVGQKVLAIGNPFALNRTLTTGVVSGLGRPVSAENGNIIQKMIQTDASINPGNSGGPLLNSRGEMIGINTTIISPSGGSIGIGFAVPIDTARRVLPDLLEFGEVSRGWIDMKPVQLFPRLVRELQLPVTNGILISDVEKGSNAERAGLKGGSRAVRWGRSVFRIGGDIIIEVDGIEISTIADLFVALEDNRPGDQVEVKYVRDSEVRKLYVQLSKRNQQVQRYLF